MSCQLTERLACQPVVATKRQVIYFCRHNQTRTQLNAGASRCLPKLFFHAEFGDDPATDLTFSNKSRSQASTEPPIGGVDADKDFGAGSESDPFTDKMVSGTIKPLTRQIAAALRGCVLSVTVQNLSQPLKNVHLRF